MLKKIVSLSLCLVMLLTVFVGCAKKDEDDKGAYVTMYLTDMVYDFDPAHAYGNESALRIVSLMFNNLFVLNEKGKVEKSLAKEYKIYEDDNAKEYKMVITLHDTCWSDGIAISANDVVYSWKRILDVSNSFDCAALLYDIKYAREAKAGDCSIDDVRIYALNETQLEIHFNESIDYDQFLYNLTSYALAPLREEVVKSTEVEDDWAKKPSTFVCSGPFRLREISYDSENAGLILERNSYYFRDFAKDAYDKSVTPYRLIVDYSMSEEEIMKAYNDGKLFFVGDIPLSVRGKWKEEADVRDAMSTHTYFLNENALIRYYDEDEFELLSGVEEVEVEEGEEDTKQPSYILGTEGEAIFAIPEVRKALSLAIDRDAIAQAVVFAKAATGVIPYGVFNTDRKSSFRDEGGNLIATKADLKAAEDELAKLDDFDASDYMFAICVPAYDEVHVKIAEMVQEAWEELGFHVAINKIDVKYNKDILLSTQEILDGVMDDIFAENVRAGLYEVAALDYTAYTPDAYSMLAPFAKGFTGGSATKEFSMEFNIPTHITGYHSEDYDAKISAIFAEKDKNARATLLHEAEKMLLEDMPIIPIIFNQTATLTSKELSKIKYTYYGTMVFTKAKLKNYELYIPEEDE